jgi:hypothetical protein
MAEDDKPKDVSDFLAAPRRKRKNYILLAVGKGFPGDLLSTIANYLKNSYKGYALANPRSLEELGRNAHRQIVLLVYDDEFSDELGDGLKVLKELKMKKKLDRMPILFLTRDAETLIEGYNKVLLAYHEGDQYLVYPKVPPSHVIAKINDELQPKNRRRSRRYKIDMPIKYYDLGRSKMMNGKLLDLSIHGALLKSEEEFIFKPLEQLKIHIPVKNTLPTAKGDFLRMSAKVRRVQIAGNQAGVSFEHVSDGQYTLLCEFLMDIVNNHVARQGRMLKARLKSNDA